MSKVKLYTLFWKVWVDYTKDNINKYNNWWAFSEIKKWEQYIWKYFDEEKKYFNLQN